jgi:hypothetical protein
VSVSNFQLATGVAGDRIADLRRQLEEARVLREIGRASALDVQRAEQAAASVSRGGGQGTGRPLIDTSFTMDVGETVVVGTSRVNGDRAIIVLLTAVAKR